MSKHKLTNKDIAEQYSDIKIPLMIYDFRGAFACWLIKMDHGYHYLPAIKAIEVYTKVLEEELFPTQDTVVILNTEQIAKFTSSSLFEAIPEVFAMNQTKIEFVDLGALSSNVYYHILREHITQPLD